MPVQSSRVLVEFDLEGGAKGVWWVCPLMGRCLRCEKASVPSYRGAIEILKFSFQRDIAITKLCLFVASSLGRYESRMKGIDAANLNWMA